MLRRIVIGCALLVLGASSALGAQADSVRLGDASRVWFTGSSNLRRFTCRARSVDGTVVLATAKSGDAVTVGGRAVDGASIDIPAARLGCGPRAMNPHLRSALGAKRHPTITFRLDGVRADSGDASAVTLSGRLTIAGRERPVHVRASVVRDPAGALHVTGTHALDVREFGVVPPRRFLGLLRVHSEAVVHFNVVVPQPGGRTASGG